MTVVVVIVAILAALYLAQVIVNNGCSIGSEAFHRWLERRQQEDEGSRDRGRAERRQNCESRTRLR